MPAGGTREDEMNLELPLLEIGEGICLPYLVFRNGDQFEAVSVSPDFECTVFGITVDEAKEKLSASAKVHYGNPKIN